MSGLAQPPPPTLPPPEPGTCWPAEEAAPRGLTGLREWEAPRPPDSPAAWDPEALRQAWPLIATSGLVSFQLLAADGRTDGWTDGHRSPSQKSPGGRWCTDGRRVAGRTAFASPHLPPALLIHPSPHFLPPLRQNPNISQCTRHGPWVSVSNTDKMAPVPQERVCVLDTEMSPGPGESLWATLLQPQTHAGPRGPRGTPGPGAQSWLSCRSPARRRWKIVPLISHLYLWGSSGAASQPIDLSDGQPAASQPQPLHTDPGCLQHQPPAWGLNI